MSGERKGECPVVKNKYVMNLGLKTVHFFGHKSFFNVESHFCCAWLDASISTGA